MLNDKVTVVAGLARRKDRACPLASARGFRLRLARGALAAAVASLLPLYAAAQAGRAVVAPEIEVADTVRDFDLPAGSLAAALEAFRSQSGIRLDAQPGLLADKQARAVRGRMGWREALGELLQGGGLEYQQANDTTIVIRRSGDSRSAAAANPTAAIPAARAARKDEPVTDIQGMTVTGTRIKGAQLTSPLVTISQEDMVLSGHNDLGQALRALPQNFSGGQNPGVLIGGSGGELANQNLTNGSSANLRGLGPDATLTLLNGTRMAYDGSAQAVDLSVVPTAAIDRVEVLLDGASAIYGSDAVGGVVNIILKRDYDGAEISARYSKATAGGNEQTQYTGVAGTTWASGGFLISADATSNDRALASQRDYLNYLPNPELVTIYPEMSQKSALFSGHQQLGSRVELTLDAYSLDRTSRYGYVEGTLFIDVGSKTSNHGAAPSLLVDLGRDWSLRLLGYTGKSDVELNTRANIIGRTALLIDNTSLSRNMTNAASIELEGELFESSAGETRLSLGGGWKESRFSQTTLSTGAIVVPRNYNSNRYGYGEIDIPLIADDHDIKFVKRFSLNGALRYENYDSFGSETTPKLGAFWGVTDNIDVRVSWGKSFKAPTLFQQYFGQFAYLFRASTFGVTDAPPGATVMRVIGGNSNLDPERAETTTAGIVFRPSFLPGMSVELGWFDIDYTQRVRRPLSFPAQAMYGPTLDNPAYSNYSIRNPSAAFQSELISSTSGLQNFSGAAYDPAAVVALFDDREVNAASQVVRGIDLGLQYATQALEGTLFVNAKGSWLTDAKRSLFEGGSESETAGVIGFPPKFKGLLGINWSKNALTLAGTLNRIGGIRNTVLTTSPKGDAMTTLDLVVDYRAQSGALGGLGLKLAIINALNQRPPHLQPSQPWFIDYDSTNYSALGRSISLAVSKRF